MLWEYESKLSSPGRGFWSLGETGMCSGLLGFVIDRHSPAQPAEVLPHERWEVRENLQKLKELVDKAS